MLTITIQLTPEVEAELRSGIARHDLDRVRELLADALEPTIEALLQETPPPLSDEEFEASMNRLASKFAAYTAGKDVMLSDYAVSRAGIYEDHP